MKTCSILYIAFIVLLSSSLCFKLNSNKKSNSKLESQSCPLPTCPAGQTKVDNGTDKKENGCGPEATSFPLELINALGNSLGSDFKECCNTHDVCFGTCGTDREECDKDFYDCMKGKCSKKSALSEAWCKVKAKSYYLMVKNGSDCFFNNSQKDHCTCV